MKWSGSIRCQKMSMGFSSMVSLVIDFNLVEGEKVRNVWKENGGVGESLYMNVGMISRRY